MSQRLPNSTDIDEGQITSEPVTNDESKNASDNSKRDILRGTTGFVKTLQSEERLIGGILISIPVVLTCIIITIPNYQRFTFACLTIGSVLAVGLIIFLLIRYRDDYHKEILFRSRELESSNQSLTESKKELQSQLSSFRSGLSTSTRERRIVLFRLKEQTNQVTEHLKLLLETDEITKDEILEISRAVETLSQQIQDELNILHGTQGSLSDSEDLEAVDPSFESALLESFKKSQES